MSKLYKGIDISYYQGDVDFEKVKNSGIDFIMIKAGQGRTAEYNAPFTDPKFKENIENAARANSNSNTYLGVYWYYTASTDKEVLEEAEYLLKLIKPYKFNIKTYVAIDVEDSNLIKSNKSTLTRHIKTFCSIIKSAGFRPLIYANSYWLEKKFTPPSDVPLWVAYWSDIIDIDKITESYPNCKIWQCGARPVSGISGNVDYNYAYDIIGDTNNDNKVNNKDISTLLKYLAGWNITINAQQADINQDGYITMKDVNSLIRLLVVY